MGGPGRHTVYVWRWLWTGAAVVLLFGMLAGWYLRRAIGRDGGSPRIAD